MTLHIAPVHPDAGRPLLQAVAAAFVAAGAAVVVGGNARNLVRRAEPGDGVGLGWVVEAEGLPNLLHEFLHFIQVGELADDHGIDYGLIPFDTGLPAQRLLLWQELACCVVSCAYLADQPDVVGAWFAEQLWTLPVFYGFAENSPAFPPFVDALVARYGAELEATIDAAYTLMRDRLEAVPPRRLGFAELWARFAP